MVLPKNTTKRGVWICSHFVHGSHRSRTKLCLCFVVGILTAVGIWYRLSIEGAYIGSSITLSNSFHLSDIHQDSDLKYEAQSQLDPLIATAVKGASSAPTLKEEQIHSKSRLVKGNSQDDVATTKQKVNMASVTVIYEKDISKDYTNHTTFNGTFFESKAPCTPLEEINFTLVTQASMDRIWIMKHHCQRWPSPLPIALAIYLPPDSPLDERNVAEELDIHLACDLTRMKVSVVKGNSPMNRYPVNLLRNLAIRSATTTHIMYTDSDFLISDGLHDDLVAMSPAIAQDPMAAVVVPAFVYHTGCPEKFTSENIEALKCLAQEWETGVPKNKNDLIPLWDKPRNLLPNVKSGFHGVAFHGSTLYGEFKNQTDPLLIPCIVDALYEPYLAVRLCKDLPEFPEVFRGYGWNKNVWIMWLTQKLNYKLWQTPQGFVVHIPHNVSASWRTLKKPNETTGKIQKPPPEHELYLKWLKRQVPKHPDRIPKCAKKK